MTTDSARLKLVLLALVLALAGAGFAVYWLMFSRFIETTDNAYVEADMSVVAPRIAGYVAAVLVAENTAVEAGQALLRIEDGDYRARLDRAAAVLSSRRAALATLESEIDLQHSLIRQAEADEASAVAEQRRANSDSQRYADLVDARAASRQQLDSAIAQASQAAAGVDATRAKLGAERQRLAVMRARRVEIEATLAEARANLELARIDLDNTVIKAPMDGVVGNKHVEVGQYLQPGVQVLTVVPLGAVHVTANFKETQLAGIAVGQPVTLAVDAYGGTEVEGVVESFSPAAGSRFSLLPPENATGNFTKIVQRIPVRIRISADSALVGRLRPGMSVVASVDTREAQSPLAGRLAQAGGR
ncbi:HlyD family secretion protein [Parahaliea mediterranea]|uniref:HlyD family secretion protein n=1 Tax=Parahaliea mediterranea TaxID=651086 RepID=A0A939IN29_9GAMM|nr:HlyD family secretion protein [Parahaliea mediterranea]MBN7798135.1 HlyD family secretion protein [Parahaliea mediterranea]